MGQSMEGVWFKASECPVRCWGWKPGPHTTLRPQSACTELPLCTGPPPVAVIRLPGSP